MTCSITRYPVHLIDVLRLAGGSRVTIRPTLPQDIDLQRAFFRALPAQARHCRFLTPLDELPDSLAERFACIDYRSHLALLAEVLAGNRSTMIGEARYAVDRADPATCELAIAVAAGWQGLGIARAFLDRLERHAAASGVQRIVAETFLTNVSMIAFARRAGFAVTASDDDPTLARLEKHLNPSVVPQPARPAAA